MLREACNRDASDALLWTLYAVQCMKVGRRDDAAQALKQAVWLRSRDRDEPRARVTRALLAHVLAGNDTFRTAA